LPAGQSRSVAAASFPLMPASFRRAFVPIVGATRAGAVAVLLALAAANGPVVALLVLAAVVVVRQVEGNLLEPLIIERQLRLDPVVVLLSIGAGTLTGGIAGAGPSSAVSRCASRGSSGSLSCRARWSGSRTCHDRSGTSG